MKTRLLPLLLFSFLVVPSTLFGWGEKGHEISTEAATFDVPNEMPQFFHEAYPELIYLANDPDRWRGAGPSLEAANPPEHFLDYEYVSALQLPPDRYAYLHLLETSGTLEKYGVSNSTPGFLPWRIAEISENLIVEWRLWRRADNPVAKREIEQEIIFMSGVLGHFVADSANPHHTTKEYNGWTRFPNPNHFRNDCDTHARFESVFISRAIDVKEVIPHVAPPQLRTDFFKTAMDSIAQSNALVERLYTIDRDGGFDVHNGTPEAREFAIARLAAGASLLRDLWWSTYKASEQAPAPRR
jgi:hypothetical protein